MAGRGATPNSSQQLRHRELRVEDVSDVALRRNLFQEAAAHRGLAGADLAGEQHEAAARIQAVQQVGQGFAMALAHEEVARVGRDGKRRVFESEERGVHGGEHSALACRAHEPLSLPRSPPVEGGQG